MTKTNLVFIHGFCFTPEIWTPVITQRLKSKFDIQVVEIPGFSEAKTTLPTFQEFAQQLNLKLGQNSNNILIGHSMGGYIALEMIHLNPSLFKAIILVNSHSMGDSDHRKRERTKQIKFIQTHGSSPYLKRFYKSLGFEDLQTTYETYGKHTTQESLIHYLNQMKERKDRTKVLNKIPCTGIIIGQKDHIIPPKTNYSMLVYINTVFLKLNLGDHMSPLAYPRQIEEIIEEVSDYNLSLL